MEFDGCGSTTVAPELSGATKTAKFKHLFPKEKTAMRLATGDDSKAIPRKIRFTVAVLKMLNPPAGKDRLWAYDELTPGLAFMATAALAKAGTAKIK